jgi:protein SCO1/2
MNRVGLVAVILLGLVAGTYGALRVSGGAEPQPAVQSTGQVLIGGPFTLVNQDGKTVTDKDFRGKLMLVFFGFTHCPDVCPTELQTIAAAMDKLGPDAKKVTPVFISVDPERDTVQSIGEYVKAFGANIIGLTGTPEQIEQAAKSYRVYYRKAKPSEGADAKDYTVDHSAFTYLMDGNGQYLTHFSFGVPPEKMAERIRQQLETDKVKLTLG